MKRMELKISLTFAIMFAIGIIISGIYSVTAMDSSFFTWGVLAEALSYSLVFLMFIWLSTRRHPLLAGLGLLSIGVFLLAIVFYFDGASEAVYDGWNWKDTISGLYCIIAFIIASYQGNKLLKEDFE